VTGRYWKPLRALLLGAVLATLAGCDDPQIYGSIGVSSGWGSHGGWGSGVHTSISVGGRIR
jgi:hypothetical protein